MVDNELQIKISADNKEVKTAIDDVATKTEELDIKLSSIAKISGVAFAALSAQVGIALHAFSEVQEASRELTNSLQNQGIYTDKLRDSYKEYAEEISKTTGIEGEELIKAQARIQSFLGQIPVTKELTQAIADLAVQQGIDLPQAATQMGAAIQTGTTRIKGLAQEFSSTDTIAQRYQKTIDFVTVKAGGFAESANTGLGAIKGLKTAFKETQEELGERFAPAAELVIKLLTGFLTPAKDSTGLMVDFKASLIAVGLAISGIAVGLPLAANAINAVKIAVAALNIQLTATRLALASLGIGLVIVAITELALHWDSVSGRIIQIVKGLVSFVSGAFSGLGTIINGAMHLDVDKMKEGWKQVQNAFKEGATTAVAEIPKATEKALTEQDAIKKRYAAKEAAFRAEQDASRIAIQKATDESIKMELENASQAAIDIKKKEIEVLKALEQSKNEEQKALLKQLYIDLQQQETEQQNIDIEKKKAFNEALLIEDRRFAAAHLGEKHALTKTETKELTAQILSEQEAHKKNYTDELKNEIAAHNTFLLEQQKYSTAYASINQVMRTAEAQGLKNSTGELVGLTQSKNAELKAIGKAATIAQIVIKTAESAMNIYAGFSAIPFVGQILGTIGAAAAIAFGAEQIGNVTAAAQGGLVAGTGYGDKMPYLLEPGELIAPRQNFNEVVNSVAASRAGESTGEGGKATIDIHLSGDLGQIVEAKLIERQRIGVSLFKTKLS